MRRSARIAILLPDLRPGGAEHLHLRLAARWSEQGIPVDFVLQQARGDLIERASSCARVVGLGARRLRNAFGPLCVYLRRERPDALLAAMWPLTVIAPLAATVSHFSGCVVVSEHAPQSLAYASRGRTHNTAMAASMRLMYPMANGLVGVSSGVVEDMARLSGLPRSAFTVIHNAAALGRWVDKKKIARPLAMPPGRVILSVGTLKAVKRYDILLRAFARLASPDLTLCLLGEGQERSRLESIARELGVESRVIMPGFQTDPAPWYAHAALFVLSSDYEGFGNVIVEALEQGTPVVSVDCPFGPREILEDGRYGTLVPVGDVEALARCMDDALSHEHDREALKRRAQDFNVEQAADAYLRLLLPDFCGREVAD